MSNLFKYFACLFILFLSLASHASGHIYNLHSYQGINDFFIKKQLFSKNTLVILDDDDTLTRLPCNIKHQKECSIGSPGWERWQLSLLSKNHHSSPYLAAYTPNGIYAISSLIHSLTRSVLVEPAFERGFLDNLYRSGNIMNIVTARSSDSAGATEDQLKKLKLLQYFSHHAFSVSKKTSLPFPLTLPSLSHPVRYEQGVLFLNGQNKAKAVSDLLSLNPNKITNIVIIDDTVKNVKQFSVQFKQKHYKLYCIHYSGMDNSKNFIISHKNIQISLSKQWNKLHQDIRNQIYLSTY